MTTMVDPETIVVPALRQLAAIVGPTHSFVGEQIDERYRTDIQRKGRCDPAIVLRPADTDQVAAIVALCAQFHLPITALGGGTGLVGGGMAEPGGVLVSLERLNTVIEVDPVAMTMTVEAGTPIEVAQNAAEAHGLILPIDLGARGTATIGGAIATNAGGTRVLRWGMMRDMVLGLEAVLADGSTVSALVKYIKNNVGYDWRHLLIGSEGTLGIVTRAVLRLRVAPRSTQTALLAAASFADAARALRELQDRLGDTLSSFELMWGDFYDFVSSAQLDKRPRPIAALYPIYMLIETLGSDSERDAAIFEAALAALLENGTISDAIIAQSQRQRDDLWSVREDLMEPMAQISPRYAFDISMALSDMERFVDMIQAEFAAQLPGAVVLIYGHAGDGNLHVAAGTGDVPDGGTKAGAIVYGAVKAVGGSVSAEHGIGRYKLPYVHFSRSPAELAMMRAIKQALDPHNLLNPGKVLPSA